MDAIETFGDHAMITMEEEAYPQMASLLDKYGLQIVLKTLADAMDGYVNSGEGLVILETIRGLHAGYARRMEADI